MIVGTGAGMLALVPGLTFDLSGYRLGYGGGFYDAFLDSFRGVSVGLCREAQFTKSLPALGAVEAHDVPVTLVVSERGIRNRKTHKFYSEKIDRAISKTF